MGGSKATLRLNRRPLIAYPLDALWRALGRVTVVAKGDSELPPLPGVEVWIEPDEPRHPLTGIVHALRRAAGRPVVVCAVDLPLVSEEMIRALAFSDRGSAPAVVARAAGRLHPTLGCFRAAALEPLGAALGQPGRPLTEVIGELEPVLVDAADPDQLFNVNTPADLLQAAAMLDRRRGQPKVKS